MIIRGGPAAAVSRSLVSWYRRNRRDLPWRRSRDPYRVWISEVMLQQTTVGAVIPYYERFLRAFPTLTRLAGARPENVLAAWSGLGYYRRARNLHAAARLISREHGGRFPRRIEDAMALPGVGRYTAGAVLSIAYGRPLPVVDANVARVLSRLGLVRGAPKAARERRLWADAAALVGATRHPGDLNQALMELGATICTPRDPDCPACPVASRCLARAAGLQRTIPPRRRAGRPVSLRADVAVIRRGGRLLLRPRKDRTLMHGLWEFPMLDAGGETDGLHLDLAAPLAILRHSITWRRLVLRVRPARLLSEPPPHYRWVRPAAIPLLPTSSIVRKVLSALDENASMTGRSSDATTVVGFSGRVGAAGAGAPGSRGRLRPSAGDPPRASQRGGRRRAKRGEDCAAIRTRAARSGRGRSRRPA